MSALDALLGKNQPILPNPAVDVLANLVAGSHSLLVVEPMPEAFAPVSRTRELERILTIPRRTAPLPLSAVRSKVYSFTGKPDEAPMSLWPLQEQALAEALEARGLFAPIAVGGGKCLGPEVPVLLYTGEIVPASKVTASDQLMGPDSHPRNVLATTTGYGPLYRITPTKGAPWVCNDAHILTLVDSVSGVVRDVPLQTVLSWRARHEQKLFQPPFIEYPEHEFNRPLDPYFLGVWLGDGTKHEITRADGSKRLMSVCICKPDNEIADVCHQQNRDHQWDEPRKSPRL